MINRRGFAPHLSCAILRGGGQLPPLRRLARPAPGRGAAGMPPLRPRRAGAEGLPSCGSVSIVRHGAGTERIEELVAELVARRRRSSGSTPTRPPARRPLPSPHRVRRCLRRRPDRDQMVAKGHDFPRRGAERARRRRLDAALPRLPRRGAHLRPRRPARRAQRPRRAGRARVLIQTSRRTHRRSSPPPGTTRPGSSPGSSSAAARFGYPPFSSLVAIELTGAGRAAPDRGRGAGRGGDRPRAELRRGAARVPPRASGAGAVTAGGCDQDARADQGRAAIGRPSSAGARAELRGVTLAVDVDPQ